MKDLKYITLITCFSVFFSLKASSQANGKPNVVFIIADDMMKQTALYGYPEIKTPNLSNLATDGVLFDRAYCQYALCGPSRASIFSSTYPSRSGITWNVPGKDAATQATALTFDIKTMPRYFRDNGYTTVGGGKLYHNTLIAETTGANYDFNIVLDASGIDGNKGTLPNGTKLTYITRNTGLTPVSEHKDGQLVESAKSWLDAYNPTQDKPFLMCIGLKKPHSPFSAPSQFWDMYQRSQEIPNIAKPTGINIPFSLNGATSLLGGHYDTYYNTGEDLPFAKKQEIIHGYYACVSFADYLVGDIVAKLKSKNLYDNTIIVFVSDHGYKLGEYDRWAKSTVHEKDAVVPLIVRDPRKPSQHGKTTKALIGLIDIYPTLAELCDIPIPENLNGISFNNVLTNSDTSFRTNISTLNVKQLPEIGVAKAISLSIIKPSGYRYTQHWDGVVNNFPVENNISEVELYDHYSSNNTAISIANIASLEEALLTELRTEVKNSENEITNYVKLGLPGKEVYQLKNVLYFYNRDSKFLRISSELSIDKIGVYNLFGSKIIDLNKNSTQVEIDLSPLIDGMYLIKVASGDKFKILKLLK